MKYIWLVVAMLLSFSALAEVDGATEEEKRYLIKIADELKRIEVLVQQSAAAADPKARVVLDYDALARDVKNLRSALERHVTVPSRTPRRVQPLEIAGSNHE